MIRAHTDVVGSLLRPPELLEAREAVARGEISQPEFKRIEDAAVDAALRLQEEAGGQVVTDGEMHRLSFQSQMTEAVDGFGAWDIDAFGDLGDKQRLNEAYSVFAAAVADIKTAYGATQ